MSTRYPGGLIRKTPVTPAGPYQTGAAPGVWTLGEAAYWTKQGLWPIAGNVQPANFIATLVTGSGSNKVYAVASDSTGNTYAGMNDANNKPVIAKYSAAGALVWQKTLTAQSGYTFAAPVGQKMAVAADGSVYWALLDYSNFYIFRVTLLKFDANGSIVWQRAVTPSGYYRQNVTGLTVDASGNVILACLYYYSLSTSTNYAAVYKYSSSGVLQWQRNVTYGTINNVGDVATDSTGNVYVAYGSGYVTKLNSSGTKVSDYSFLRSGSPVYPNGILIDSSDNLYANVDIDADNVAVCKLNSAMAVQWATRYWSGYTSQSHKGIVVDSSGNAYATTYGDNPYLGFVAKINSAGTWQWTRYSYAGSTGNKSQMVALALAPGGNLVIGGELNSSLSPSVAAIWKVPSDGTKTGTYTVGSYSVVYANNGTNYGTPYTITVTAFSGSSVTTPSDSEGAGGWTISAASETSAVTVI